MTTSTATRRSKFGASTTSIRSRQRRTTARILRASSSTPSQMTRRCTMPTLDTTQQRRVMLTFRNRGKVRHHCCCRKISPTKLVLLYQRFVIWHIFVLHLDLTILVVGTLGHLWNLLCDQKKSPNLVTLETWDLRVIHITAFSACVCGRRLRFRREIENFLSLHWRSPLRKTQTAASSVNQPLVEKLGHGALPFNLTNFEPCLRS